MAAGDIPGTTGIGGGAPASRWLQRLETPARLAAFRRAYGGDSDFLQERARLAQAVVSRFIEAFGDKEVRLFRAPGRINLRGMHVDTHGGFLNLMTHQREIMIAARGVPQRLLACVNLNADYHDVVLDLAEEESDMSPQKDWSLFFGQGPVRARIRQRGGEPGLSWANYLSGAAMRLQWMTPNRPLSGVQAVVGGDLPRGVSLSSSAALSTATLLALSAINGMALPIEALIRAEQEVEWYAGARVGMSDQTAILMGKPGQVLHLAVFARDLDLSQARYASFPETLRILVIDSRTTRMLSGAQRLRYSLNRFAYSMAMTVLREELRRQGMPAPQLDALDRLSRLDAQTLGGVERAYGLLRAVPSELSLHEMRQRYHPENLHEAYDQYFGDLEPDSRPRVFPLRGPLIFGISESMRAQLFFKALTAGDAALMGRLMCVGHDGDRVMDSAGNPYAPDLDNAALEGMARRSTPLEWCPGAYGASSPPLDMLVDAAMSGKALGACLTGAGIAGALLALCHAEAEPEVRARVQTALRSETYRIRANREAILGDEQAAAAIVTNRGIEGAGELRLDDQ